MSLSSFEPIAVRTPAENCARIKKLGYIVGSLLIFGALWLALLLSIIATILFTPWFPHGLIPFVVIMAVEMLVTTCLIAAVSVTTESQGWMIGVTQFGALGLNAVGFTIVRLPAIGQAMSGRTIQWNATTTTILLAEFALIVLLIGITFFVQSRKRDFI